MTQALIPHLHTAPDPTTRRSAVLAALQRGARLTHADALRLGWGWRLAADIHALRERGWAIQTTLEQKTQGRRPVARYWLDLHNATICGEV